MSLASSGSDIFTNTQIIMKEINDRKLPVGIQSFEEIRKDGYLYVDKTDIIWHLAYRGKKYNYLS